jgi:serine/threonine protein phosphatase PrpC
MTPIATRTEAGDRGEDRLAVVRTPAGAVMVVADGAGGVGGAAVAAQSICDFILAHAPRAIGDPRVWADALREADALLAAASHGGQTTAVVVELNGLGICGASVGDSGAWVVTDSGIIDLTDSQSRKPLMGSGTARPVSFGPVLERGRLLLASDGIFKYARREELAACALIVTLEDAVTAVIDAVRLRNRSLQDDVAVILCDLPG